VDYSQADQRKYRENIANEAFHNARLSGVDLNQLMSPRAHQLCNIG